MIGEGAPLLHRVRLLAPMVLGCIVVGTSVDLVSNPYVYVAAVGTLMAIAVASAYGGALGVLLIMFTGIALVPIVNHPTLSSIRDGLIVGLTALAGIKIARSKGPGVPARARPIAACLGSMAVLGLVVTAFTSTSYSDYAKEAAQAAGQPLIYVAVFVVLIWMMRRSPDTRRLLVAAWCVAVIAEGLFVAGQLATGAAYDSLRGYTRAQGTMGSDFLGVFAAMGLFAGAYLRTIGMTRRFRLLGDIAIAAGAFSLIASISRGPVIGFGLALGYLFIARDTGMDAGRRLLQGIAVAVVTGFSLYAMQGLWSARLDAKNTSSFDRPATWIAGTQIIAQHPILGVGPRHVSAVVAANTQNSSNPNNANPSNSWLFAAAAEGLPYALLLVWVSVAFVRVIAKRTRERADHYLLASLIAGGTVLFSDNVFTHPENMLYILLAGAILVARPSPDRSGEGGLGSRRNTPAPGSMPVPNGLQRTAVQADSGM